MVNVTVKELKEAQKLNKYNLTMPLLRKNLYVKNEEGIKKNPFWRNDVIQAWCVSGGTIGEENEYWLGIYDKDAETYAGKIRIHFTTYDGMCSYDFDRFFTKGSVENRFDFDIQKQFILRINRLIEDGVLGLR